MYNTSRIYKRDMYVNFWFVYKFLVTSRCIFLLNLYGDKVADERFVGSTIGSSFAVSYTTSKVSKQKAADKITLRYAQL